jgi:hypothetical protein
MNTANSGADIRFLRLVLATLIAGTVISGGVCAKLATAQVNSAPTEIAARY